MYSSDLRRSIINQNYRTNTKCQRIQKKASFEADGKQLNEENKVLIGQQQYIPKSLPIDQYWYEWGSSFQCVIMSELLKIVSAGAKIKNGRTEERETS
ncbi:hypothetical protein CEXT_220181 [Caerostris extrusa]|uniref:Uncharacterized protein n=1 Tax=Caerostris extrusa TaxID=172846 RepID=A0AAV4MMD7_CAEEX|nr:hypothetical protein CEXT_220181 [Caerostris extrusa]